jgi:spermidine synthase
MSREQVLTRLQNLSAERPTTQMGQVRWAWPSIQAALAAGHTLQLVHKRLNEAGIAIGYRTLSLYIGRLEREQAMGRTHDVTAARHEEKTTSPGLSRPQVGVASGEQSARDPFANIRREREKKRNTGFAYDAFSTNKNVLE